MRTRWLTALVLVLLVAVPAWSAEKAPTQPQANASVKAQAKAPAKKTTKAQVKSAENKPEQGRSGTPKVFASVEVASADGRLRVRVPDQVEQGGVALAHVASADAVASVTVQWNGKDLTLPMRPSGLGGVETDVLVPMPVDAAAGKPLVLDVRAGHARVTLPVRARPVNWPRQEITVEDRYVTPPKAVTDRIAAEREKVNRLLANVDPETRWGTPFVRPVPGEPSSVFGGRRIFNGQPRSTHRGVDLRGAQGASVHALAAGRVVVAEEHYFSGNVVYLDHGQGFITLYAHLSAFDVRAGDFVEAGQIVGRVGATGRVTGPHLHLGALLRGQAVNPLALLALE